MAYTTSTVQFKPFSYEQIVAPLKEATEAHNKIEDEITSLSASAESLRAQADKDPDAAWAKRFVDYANRLDAQASALASSGLNPGIRAGLIGLKKDYMHAVDAPTKALKRLSDLSDAIFKQDPAKRYHVSALPTIDALIDDPTLKPVMYSGAAVEESALKAAAASATRNVQNYFTRYGGYWMKQLEQTGYSKEVMNGFLQNASNVPELKAIIDMVTGQFNNFEGMSESQKNALKQEIITGIFKGAGYAEKVNYQQDPVAVNRINSRNSGSGDGDDLPDFFKHAPTALKLVVPGGKASEIRGKFATQTINELMRMAQGKGGYNSKQRAAADKWLRDNGFYDKNKKVYLPSKAINALSTDTGNDLLYSIQDGFMHSKEGSLEKFGWNVRRNIRKVTGVRNEDAINAWSGVRPYTDDSGNTRYSNRIKGVGEAIYDARKEQLKKPWYIQPFTNSRFRAGLFGIAEGAYNLISNDFRVTPGRGFNYESQNYNYEINLPTTQINAEDKQYFYSGIEGSATGTTNISRVNSFNVNNGTVETGANYSETSLPRNSDKTINYKLFGQPHYTNKGIIFNFRDNEGNMQQGYLSYDNMGVNVSALNNYVNNIMSSAQHDSSITTDQKNNMEKNLRTHFILSVLNGQRPYGLESIKVK